MNTRVATGPGGVSEQRGEGLHPAEHGHMIDLGTALGEQLLDIAIREPEPQDQRTARAITSGGNPNSAER